jgi:hypothetical protein
VNHAVVDDSNAGPIFEGLPGEVRRWLNGNEWALMFDVRVGPDKYQPAVVYLGRREPLESEICPSCKEVVSQSKRHIHNQKCVGEN